MLTFESLPYFIYEEKTAYIYSGYLCYDCNSFVLSTHTCKVHLPNILVRKTGFVVCTGTKASPTHWFKTVLCTSVLSSTQEL